MGWIVNLWTILAFSNHFVWTNETQSNTSLAFSVTPSSSASTKSLDYFDEEKFVSIKLGEEINLSCTNRTWSTMLFDTWELKHTDEMKCRIANSSSDPAVNTCNDGRILINTTEGRSQLHIPSFKYTYEGIYKCQTAFQHGSHKILFNVSVIVQPEISGRIEYSPNDNHSVAVCEASSGKPKASISWTSDENVTDKITYNQNRTFTVESRLIIPYNTSMESVTCIVSHPYWNESQTYTISLKGTAPFIVDHHHKALYRAQHPVNLIYWIVIPACLLCVLLTIFVTYFVCIKKHLADLRNCCKSTIPVATAPTKTQQDVEEVEPYASYVERVNSIYNSSAELCNV
ncbi:cell surface glycoprotein CD200 receptor 2-like isoform X2 [Polyodon spathula]|uniref:cell surface glycoprotein CD200 receptor 2-like isoform X2 n=1 Tax=Polyodon spathula TaxID=7913 RepID=UPI001B7F69E8|nr:cell surface glycoprotein CD200 receptor 2-like isoform X2 [Polyodon spathula]